MICVKTQRCMSGRSLPSFATHGKMHVAPTTVLDACPPLPWSRRAQRLNCRRKTQRRQQQTGCRENKSCPVANSTRRLSSSTTTLPARGPPVGTTRMLHRTDLEPQRGRGCGIADSRCACDSASHRLRTRLVRALPGQTADPSPRRNAA